jgi:hypothetical protein
MPANVMPFDTLRPIVAICSSLGFGRCERLKHSTFCGDWTPVAGLKESRASKAVERRWSENQERFVNRLRRREAERKASLFYTMLLDSGTLARLLESAQLSQLAKVIPDRLTTRIQG